MESKKFLNNKWILWYHDPLDTNWDLSSYKNLHEISSIHEFWEIYKFLDNNIVENSMLFLMRDGIKPLWEDDKNVPGLIAEEVKELYPELTDSKKDELVGVHYTRLIPILITSFILIITIFSITTTITTTTTIIIIITTTTTTTISSNITF